MKRSLAFLSLILLLNGCKTNFNLVTNAVGYVSQCPQQDAPAKLTTSTKNQSFSDRFNYHIHNIEADKNLLKFQAKNYDFVFCRGNNQWVVQPGTLSSELKSPQNYAEVQKNLINPPLKKIELKGKQYQYRVLLSPNPFQQPSVNADSVIFEIVSPNSKTPKRQTLYTLKDLQQGQLGTSLGVPRVTSAIIYSDRLWWTIASEQGEGANGIATIINYDPQKDEVKVIQPEEIKRQQITDLAITGDTAKPTFWLGTQLSGKGNAYLRGMGLVAYRPEPQNLNKGSVTSYNLHNSPIVGAIPDKLYLEKDKLWVATGNGVCQVKWQVADNPDSWSCWRYALLTQLPANGVQLYTTLMNQTSAATLSFANGEPLEVLWWNIILLGLMTPGLTLP